MVILEVYSKSLKIIYKARVCSKATIFIIVTTIIAIIIPFVFAYNSRGFWIKHDTFYEQPDVKFRGEYLFNAATGNFNSPIVCSSFPYFKDVATFDKCSLVKAREIDNNKDGKVDELEFGISIEIEGSKIVSFYVALTFDYSLHTVCPVWMQSAIIIQHTFQSFSSSEINFVGNMGLVQTSPLLCHPKWENKEYNYSIVQNNLGLYSYDIKTILLNYSKRNMSTHLMNQYTTFNIGDVESELLVKLKIRFPEHKVYYSPSFWQVVKWAWIQYFTLYVIFAWIVKKIRNYVFKKKLILFYEVSPLKKIQ